MKKIYCVLFLLISFSLLVLPISAFAQPKGKIAANQSMFEDEIVDSPKEKQSLMKK
jgi:LAS superfamily LD-carboxypeptidase LdcB